ncbi:hypothetical protein FDECE_18594 [Fusarium decemcellulare]|nr:hypothetical protein FDECE_18594 [Fusarium decemcellulare]
MPVQTRRQVRAETEPPILAAPEPKQSLIVHLKFRPLDAAAPAPSMTAPAPASEPDPTASAIESADLDLSTIGFGLLSDSDIQRHMDLIFPSTRTPKLQRALCKLRLDPLFKNRGEARDKADAIIVAIIRDGLTPALASSHNEVQEEALAHQRGLDAAEEELLQIDKQETAKLETIERCGRVLRLRRLNTLVQGPNT